MDTKHSTSNLPWISVIETLATSNELVCLKLLLHLLCDINCCINCDNGCFDFSGSCITDLVKRTPEVSDDMGRNARELVSLRVLETLYVQEISNANNDASVPRDKIKLDQSECCEDVLRHLLFGWECNSLFGGNTNGLQENQPRTLVPYKRRIDASTAHEGECSETEPISENICDTCIKASKRFKREVISPRHDPVDGFESSQRDGVATELSAQILQPIVQKGNLENGALVGCLDGKIWLHSLASELSDNQRNRHVAHVEQRRTSLERMKNCAMIKTIRMFCMRSKEARSAPVGRNSLDDDIMEMLSPQPKASVPREPMAAAQKSKISPPRSHRSKQKLSRVEEELCHNEDSKKNSLNQVEEPGNSPPVSKSSPKDEVTQTGSPQPEASAPPQLVSGHSTIVEESSEDEDTIASQYCVRFRNSEKN
ncbi:hypothetical protein RND71_007988 [Anisodus tanguticus]|uniref:Uncharacterized protein n=1 Tax=Anisodus tanguticus TaxID=243964 RepID=A0AAE1SMS8_9SOLA|nr:hypothetical protein RND71_007988 [Anisodus tanguticus]